LTAQPGTWTGTQPIGYAYQWQKCSTTCSAIAGATSRTLLLARSTVGEHLRILVTATNAAGSVQRASAQVGPVAAAGGTRALLMSLIVPAGRTISGASLLRHGGYTRIVAVPARARLTITWSAGPRTGGHSRTVLVARVVTRLRGGKSRVAIRLTSAGRRTLRNKGRIMLDASGRLQVAGQQTAVARRTFTVHR
jgi:hypothetical protein